MDELAALDAVAVASLADWTTATEDTLRLLANDAEIEWAVGGTLAAEFRSFHGRALDPLSRQDVIWALDTLRRDVVGLLTEVERRDPDAVAELRTRALRLHRAAAEVATATDRAWCEYSTWRARVQRHGVKCVFAYESNRVVIRSVDDPAARGVFLRLEIPAPCYPAPPEPTRTELAAALRAQLDVLSVETLLDSLQAIPTPPPRAAPRDKLPVRARVNYQTKWVWVGVGDTVRHLTVESILPPHERQEGRVVDIAGGLLAVSLIEGADALGIEELWQVEEVELAPREPAAMFDVVLPQDLEAFRTTVGVCEKTG